MFDPTPSGGTDPNEDSLPHLVLPEMWPVVETRRQAAEGFSKLTISIGVGESGPIRFFPNYVPHRLVLGATRSGKSSALDAELMQYFAALYRVFIVDGKGTDYSAFARFPNVSAVSTDLHQHVLVIHLVWTLLKQRQQRAVDMKRRGEGSWRDTVPPVLLVLDEFAAVRRSMKEMLGSEELRLIDREVEDILKIGREFRINIILATQDMRADTVPSDWIDLFKVVQSLGKPSPIAVRKAFPHLVQDTVEQIGDAITTPGRGVVAITGEGGPVTAQLYQAHWSYSPTVGFPAHIPIEVRSNWEEFKREVADRIPRVYPRVWAKIEYPDPEPGCEDQYEPLRRDSWVDLGKMSVQDIHRLVPVDLEDPVTLARIADNAEYDPLSDSYRGIAPPATGITDLWS